MAEENSSRSIFMGSDNIHRWYDLVPETLKAHAPDWGRLPRSDFDLEEHRNLAPQAEVQVDSFYGTVNVDDRALMYPTLNQVEIAHRPVSAAEIQLRLATNTPAFEAFCWRVDSLAWVCGAETALCWSLHEGLNSFEARVRNRAGKLGRTSRLQVSVRDGEITDTVLENGRADVERIAFQWEDFCHPTLQALREKYDLDGVVAGAESDLQRTVLLRDWLKARWDHDQPLVSPPWDAAYILDHTDKKIESFYCVHYSLAYMQLCLALGIPARLVNLHRGICALPLAQRGYGQEMDAANPCDEHVLNEVWLDDLGKWAVMDVDFDIHYTRAGVPLSGLEIHDLLAAGRLAELEPCEGPYAYKLRSSDDFYHYKLPVYYTHFCLFWRNNHLSDPEGPTRIMHWVDDFAPAMLWWQGEDLRHRPQIIGPIAVSWPYDLRTPVLTDMNMASHWASSEEPTPHWVELTWDEPQAVECVHLLWAKCWGHYFSACKVRVLAWQGEAWVPVAELQNDQERAFDVIAFDPIQTRRLKIIQPLHAGSAAFPDRFWLAEIGIQ